MKRFFLKGRVKLNPILVAVILLLSAYFLVRLFTLSFSDKIGQAKHKLSNSVLTRLCISMMESGSSLVKYQNAGEKVKYPFPISLAADRYTVHTFIKDNPTLPAISHTELPEPLENTIVEPEPAGIKFHDIRNGILTREYILTNGAVFDGNGFRDYLGTEIDRNTGRKELPVSIMEGAIDFNEVDNFPVKEDSAVETMRTFNGTEFTLDQLTDISFLIRHFYIVDPATRATDALFDAKVLLGMDMTLKAKKNEPQILIYHTHSQEAFADSREGEVKDTVVGIGDYLTSILEEKYGYNVIHDRSCYDVVDGKHDRNLAYNYARDGIEKILEEYPGIEVIIDLHRDGMPKRSTMLNGKETAQIMLFNGLCRDQNGPLPKHDNPNLQANLAFSLQLQLKSLELYPGLFYRNYLQAWRYNQDVREKCILMELGTDENTLESARNAMEPFADILDAVLSGE